MSLTDQINGHSYLYLNKLQEFNDLELEIWINEAKVSASTEMLSENSSAYGPIVSDDTCKSYKISVKEYVVYCVTNESCGAIHDDEEFSGSLFRHYSKSRFMAFAKASKNFGYLEEVKEQDSRHIGIVCLNQIIDIVCFDDVKVEEIARFDDSM